MKHVQTFDLVRTIATLGMALLHSLVFQWKGAVQARFLPGDPTPPLDAQIIMYFLGLAGLFFIISGAVQFISLNNAIQRENHLQKLKGETLSNKDRDKTVQKYCLGGIIMGLLMLGFHFIFNLLFNPLFGYIHFIVEHPGTPWTFNIAQLFHNDAPMALGWNFIIDSCLIWLLFRNGGWQKKTRNYLILSILAAIILAITPFTRIATFEPMIGAYAEGNWLLGALFAKFGDIWFPIFPNIAYGFIGVILGMALADDISKKRYVITFIPIGVLLLAIGLGGILIKFGAIYVGLADYGQLNGFPITDYDLELLFDSYIFRLLLGVNHVGFAFIIFFLLFLFIDYKPDEVKIKRYRRGQWAFRVGKLSLTVFAFESLLRQILGYLWTWIIPGWDQPLYVVLMFGFFNVIVWIIIATLWAKIGYKGSVEWLLMKGIELVIRKKTNKFDPQTQAKSNEEKSIIAKIK